MSGRGASSRRAIEKLARETEIAEEAVLAEAELAEERGAERLRVRLREMLEERRRVVRLGEQQIEVVEVSAVEDVLGPETDRSGDQPGESTGD